MKKLGLITFCLALGMLFDILLLLHRVYALCGIGFILHLFVPAEYRIDQWAKKQENSGIWAVIHLRRRYFSSQMLSLVHAHRFGSHCRHRIC